MCGLGEEDQYTEVVAVPHRPVACGVEVGPARVQYGCFQCSIQRNFLTFGFIHSKLHNCLNEELVQKMVYIKMNNMQFTKQ